MEIIWLGHSCFRLRGRDLTIITDPFSKDLGYPPLKTSADVVTVSHYEPNHAALDAVGGSPRIVDGPGEYEIRGAMIQGVATKRGQRQRDGSAATKNTAYAIRLDDLLVVHLGDLAQPLTAEQVEALKDPSVLLVPVGGHCTIGASEAAEVISQLEPRIVIPMHFRTAALSMELDTLERFCREMAVAESEPQPRLSVNHGSLPDETTVVFLDYRR